MIKKINQNKLALEIERSLRKGKNEIKYLITKTPLILLSKKNQVDEVDCIKLGYDVVEIRNSAGTIVSNEGDVIIGFFTEIHKPHYQKFIEYFANWLQERGLEVTLNNNDILVNDNKICGMCCTRYGRINYFGCFISINANLEHIKQLCKKPMIKVPKGLSEFGITTEEVEQLLLDFVEQNPFD